jgi:hypothetical protein
MFETEYDVKLEIPTDNCVALDFFPHDLGRITEFLEQIKVANQETLIVLYAGFQCLEENNHWINSIVEFVEREKNPLIIFNGKLDNNFVMTNINFLYYKISMFELVSNFYWAESKCNKEWLVDCYRKKNIKFYWASTKDWYTRRYILSGIIRYNLLNQGLVNYKCVYTNIPSDWLEGNVDKSLINEIEYECNLIAKQIPLPHLDDTVEFNQTNVNFYLSSIVGIVTDTYFEKGIFFSEKVFNAMNYLQIFFYIGYNGSLKYLKNQGYEIFDNIIDISYDDIVDPGERLIAARKSLIKFLDRPIEKLQEDYNKCLPAIIHNKKLVQSKRPDLEFTNTIKNFLNEH